VVATSSTSKIDSPSRPVPSQPNASCTFSKRRSRSRPTWGGVERVRLVVSTLPQAGGMQRHRDHAARRQAFDRQSLGDELSERTGKTSPALVLEPMHRLLDRPFVRDRGPQPRERPQPGAAPTLTPGGFNLHPAVSAQRLLQVPDFRAARVAKPSAQPATSATPRRQHEIKKRHMVSVCKRVNVLLTG